MQVRPVPVLLGEVQMQVSEVEGVWFVGWEKRRNRVTRGEIERGAPGAWRGSGAVRYQEAGGGGSDPLAEDSRGRSQQDQSCCLASS